MIEQIVSPLAKRLGGGIPIKNFMRFDSTAQTAISYPMPFSIDGGFEIEFYYYLTSALGSTTFFSLYTGNSDEYLLGKYNGVGIIKLQSQGVTPGQSYNNYDDDRPHKVVYKLSGTGAIKVYIDDFLEYESQHSDMAGRVTGRLFSLLIGGKKEHSDESANSHIDGYLWDFKMWTGGDRETGTLLIDAPLDSTALIGHNRAYRPEPLTRQELAPPYSTVSSRLGSTGGSTSISAMDGSIEVLRIHTSSSWLARYRDTYQAGFYEARIFAESDDWEGTLGVLAYSHDKSESIEQARPFREGENFARIVFEAQNGEDISVILSGNSQTEDIGKVVQITNIEIRPLSHHLGGLTNFVESDFIRMTKKADRWYSENLSSFTSTELLGDDANPEFAPTAYTLIPGRNYNISARFTSFTGGSDAGFDMQGDMPPEHPFRKSGSPPGDTVGGDLRVAQDTPLVPFGRATSIVSYDNLTVREYIEPPKQPKSRNFRKFDSTAQTRVNLNSQTISGDFEVELHFVVYDKTNYSHIFGGGLFGFRIDTGDDGRIRVLLPKDDNSGSYYRPIDGSEPIEVGKVYNVGLKRVGNNFTSWINDAVDTFTFTDIANDLPLGYVGTSSIGTWHLDGSVFDVYLWVDGDRVTGELLLDMPLDDTVEFGLVENKAATLTDITASPYTIAEPESGTYIENPDGSFTVSDVTDASFGPTWSSGISADKSYIVYFEVTEIVGTVLFHRWGAGWAASKISSETITKPGKYRLPLIDTSVFRFRSTSHATEPDSMFTVRNLRIYESDKLQAFGENFIESDVEFFRFWKEGKYLGPELVTQDVWENPNAVHESGWSFNESQNTWALEGDGSYEQLKLLSSTEYPNQYLLSFTVENLSGPFAYLEQNGFVTDDGTHTFLVGPDDAGQTFKRNSGIANATLYKPSIREILEFK